MVLPSGGGLKSHKADAPELQPAPLKPDIGNKGSGSLFDTYLKFKDSIILSYC